MRRATWVVLIAATIPMFAGGCAGSRVGPASHVLVVGDHEGPRWNSLIDARDGPWRTSAVEVSAHGAFSYVEGWWPSPDGTSVVVTGRRVGETGRRESRMALVRVDGSGTAPFVFGPVIHHQATRVGWAPDSAGFAVIARDDTGQFGCSVFGPNADSLASFGLPRADVARERERSETSPIPRTSGEEGVSAHLSPGGKRVAFVLRGRVYIRDLAGQQYLDVPESVARAGAIRVVGWLADGRLAIYGVGAESSSRALTFLTVPTWEEHRTPVSRDLGGVVSVHPRGSPYLARDRDTVLLMRTDTWNLGWITGESDSIPGGHFTGWGWVPAEE